MNFSFGLSGKRIFLYKERCDMRRSFDRLAQMVVEGLGEDPLSGDLYIFLNSRCRMVKCLYWDEDGYAIWYKRLEEGRFIRPLLEGVELSELDLAHLLSGVDVDVVRREPRYRAENKKNS